MTKNNFNDVVVVDDAVVPADHQAPYGLGIVPATDDDQTPLAALDFDESSSIQSKNNAFFYGQAKHAAAVAKPPPPPPLKTGFHKQHPHHHEESHVRTFADRIRAIVAENSKNSPSTPMSATKIKLNIANFFKKFNLSEKIIQFPNDEIVPLPSPAEPTLTRSNTFTKHQVLSPSKIDSAIPLVSLSPSFLSDKTNIVPSVKDMPMLGDIEPAEIPREVKFPSPELRSDSNLKGKHIWKFRIMDVLGVGAFATVYLAENLEEGGYVAIKTINKERMLGDLRMKSSVEREVGVLKYLEHDRIVQLEASMETEQHLCLVMEYVQGGELYDFVKCMHRGSHQKSKQWNILNELVIKKLVLELIEVLIWLHERNIVHRDIKLENIMVYFDQETNEPHIKLTDFGLARVIDPNEPKLSTRCGSCEYVSPEIVQDIGYDGCLSDTWSLGIVVYAMLVGYLPFTYDEKKGETVSNLFYRIILGKLKWPNSEITPEAKEVVGRLLTREANRITLQEVIKLPWFQGV